MPGRPVRLLIVSPPPTKPSEPGLSGAAAAARLRALGVEARWIDASVGWLQHLLGEPTPGGRWSRPQPLRHMETYRDRRRYSSAVARLLRDLGAATAPWPGLSLRSSDLAIAGFHQASSADLARFAVQPGPFDDYLLGVLLPEIAGWAPTHVGVSLTFYPQGFAAFRLARLLAERLSGVERILAGPLVDCWAAAGAPLLSAPFRLFNRVLPLPDEAALAAFARSLGAPALPVAEPLAAGLEEAPWEAYLSPQPVVPMALGRGCYWGRCTFCPDHLHARWRPCGAHALEAWLHRVAARLPAGAMLHLTDSALPPRHLLRLADVIARDRLPLRWHGFARLEPAFARPEVARRLAEGGAAMLQWGLETASPPLLERLGKGRTVEQARAVLHATAAAGIKNHVYLLFGQPGETEADRDATLAFIAEERAHIHDLNNALLNLPRGSPMHRDPAAFGITSITPFSAATDLSLYDDFRCGDSHPRLEARRWLGRVFAKHPAVRAIQGNLNAPLGANHGCFLP
ncbi:MAG: radical SAM protein [Pseudomonadota bacterium]